jgi:hypothetical protein
MDGTAVAITTENRHFECLLMSSTKNQKLMRKASGSRGRDVDFFMINITPTTEQLAYFHALERLTAEQREIFQTWIYDGFPELLKHVNSPHVGRHCDNLIEANGPMKLQHRNILSHAEGIVLNRVYISLRRAINGHINTLDSGGVMALHL